MAITVKCRKKAAAIGEVAEMLWQRVFHSKAWIRILVKAAHLRSVQRHRRSANNLLAVQMTHNKYLHTSSQVWREEKREKSDNVLRLRNFLIEREEKNEKKFVLKLKTLELESTRDVDERRRK